MPQYTENDIKFAIQAVQEGATQREASIKWGIPRSTLQDRLNGSTTKAASKEAYQRLSKQQENHLRDWVLAQGALGLPPTHKQLKEFATRILVASNDLRPLGKHWITSFLARNPGIRTVRGKPIDSIRTNGATTKIIKDFFCLLDLPLIKAIPPQNRYNMDETGILEGRGSNGLVLGSSKRRSIIKKQPGTRCWTTIIECISATGQALSPLVIFKGQTVQQQWFPDEMEFLADWRFTATPKGWTNDSTALEWLQQIFIPQTRARSKDKVLLIVDGHGSHTTDNFMYECFKNDIYLLFLPPHTSHVLQPLDISIFSPIKTAYRSAIDTYPDAFDSSPAGKITFLCCYHKARLASLTNKNIRNGFVGSGLWPVNMAKPLLSRLLIKTPEDGSQVPITQETVPLETQGIKEPNMVVFKTPTRSQQLRGMIDFIKLDDPAIRLLFRKIGRGLDQQNIKLAEADAKIKELEHLIQCYRPQKRQKVIQDLNNRFVKIDDVRKARQRYEELLAPSRAADVISTYQFEDLCYEFELE